MIINLISKTPERTIEQIGRANYEQYCGLLTTPQTGYDVSKAHRWALDNGCYKPGYDAIAIQRHLDKWAGQAGCLFAVMPDVVGNHLDTMKLCRQWINYYHLLGYPPAFALQNGVTVETVPYAEIAAVFVGGDNAFKYSADVRAICTEAHQRGLWVHVGRVGGIRRFRYCRDVLGADSFDSTGFSTYPPKLLEENWIAEMSIPPQKVLW